jgi:glucuronoarabinoxylan endo-1,4-beta-xylanase
MIGTKSSPLVFFRNFAAKPQLAMKKIITLVMVLASAICARAVSITLTVSNTRQQTVTGFGAACCDGAMCPFGNDTQPVKLLYGPTSAIGLNIMRMEISPNFVGDVIVPEWGNYDTPYDWKGSLPSAKIVKQRGGIVFGTPWSPPGEYKTNGTAQGGNAADQGNQRGQLREDCYVKFFPWLNTFLAYMKKNGVAVDAVSIQNEPDWWVNYSGCLYTPQQQLNLVRDYAHMLDRETYSGVRLISAEPLGFDPSYSDMLLSDAVARDQVDIIAGHLYGHPPLGNMKSAATLASQYGKEVWMTEHSVTDNIDHLPNWHEQLIFAEELNECMLAGCTGYIYWYMRAHWAFVGTGETKYNPGNTKNKLLPRAYVMSHFSKHVTGSTRLATSRDKTSGQEAALEFSAYIKGDSLIVMAIDTVNTAYDMQINLPMNVKSGTHLVSTGNETAKLCQEQPIAIGQPTATVSVQVPARSLNTYIFIIDQGSAAVEELPLTGDDGRKTYYDLRGRRLHTPRGVCIEKSANGSSRVVMM